MVIFCPRHQKKKKKVPAEALQWEAESSHPSQQSLNGQLSDSMKCGTSHTWTTTLMAPRLDRETLHTRQDEKVQEQTSALDLLQNGWMERSRIHI